MSKRKLTYKDFKNYFGNNLPNKDKHAFEKDIMRDEFDEEAFEGLSTLNAEELENDIAELKLKIDKRAKKTRVLNPIWYRYAASAIIIVGLGLSLFFINSRFWKDSMLKEQFSEEMKIVDSLLFETELELGEEPDQSAEMTGQIQSDTTKQISNDLIAANDMAEGPKEIIVSDKADIEDELIIESEKSETKETKEIAVIELQVEEVAIEEAEVLLAENSVKEKTEDVQIETQASQELQGRVAGVEVKKSARSKSSERKSQIDKGNTASRIIRGKIVGTEDNLSIPGVSVTVKDNPTIGTTTNIDGEFSITVPDDDDELRTLIASFVGMKPTEIDILGDTNILVYMESDVLAMDEVVVTAIGIPQEYIEYDEMSRTGAKPPNKIGKAKYKKILLDKIDYSKLDKFSGEHTIKFSFTVGVTGELSEFNFTQSPDKAFNNEIIRVMTEAGNWIPATDKNQNIDSIVKLSLKIEIN